METYEETLDRVRSAYTQTDLLAKASECLREERKALDAPTEGLTGREVRSLRRDAASEEREGALYAEAARRGSLKTT